MKFSVFVRLTAVHEVWNYPWEFVQCCFLSHLNVLLILCWTAATVIFCMLYLLHTVCGFSFSLSYSGSSIPGRGEPQATAAAGTWREQVPETLYPIPVPFRDRSEGIHCCEWWSQPRIAVLEHWPPDENVRSFSLSRCQWSTFRVGGPGASLLQ